MGVALTGALVGLLVALFANVVVLPRVLRAQEKQLSHGPFFGFSQADKLGSYTKLTYRYLMPIFFAVLGAVAAVQLTGNTP